MRNLDWDTSVDNSVQLSTTSIRDLPNLGNKSVGLLREIGVYTDVDLRELGAVTAYCLLKAQNERVSVNMLWALYGALNDLDWREIPTKTKAILLDEVAHFRFDN